MRRFLIIAAALCSTVANAEQITCRGHASGGNKSLTLGNCALYYGVKGENDPRIDQIGNVCDLSGGMCEIRADAKRYCEAGFCEWQIKSIISVRKL